MAEALLDAQIFEPDRAYFLALEMSFMRRIVRSPAACKSVILRMSSGIRLFLDRTKDKGILPR
jgi:hypothetical protein